MEELLNAKGRNNDHVTENRPGGGDGEHRCSTKKNQVVEDSDDDTEKEGTDGHMDQKVDTEFAEEEEGDS